VKLLRAIQEGEVDPVGGKRAVKVDVRIVSATNRDLIADVKAGRFREDLFYRLHVFPIGVPPLRERAEDVPELVRHFLVRFAAEEGKRLRAVSAEALHLLRAYSWPGNVRQLENAVFRAVVLADTDAIGVDEFPQIAAQVSDSGAAVASTEAPLVIAPASEPAPAIAPVVTDSPAITPSDNEFAAAGTPHGALGILDRKGDIRPLEEIETDVIRFAIAHYRGQMSEVARRLRIGRSTLYRKLRDLGLEGDSISSGTDTEENGVSAE
jgi:DNA-binding NtrC family response regulator